MSFICRNVSYICKNCGLQFDDPELTHNGGYYEEPWYECPYCGSDAFDEAETCDICDELCPSDSLTNGVCKKCIERKSDDIMTLMRFAIDAFTPEELDELIGKGTFKQEVKQVALDNESEFVETIKEEKKDD